MRMHLTTHSIDRLRRGVTRRSATRRGVLLLVVLSLLVLFSLVGLTFVLVASRYYDTVKRSLRNEQVGSSPRDLCDDVLAQLVRGTNNPMSAIRSHDLLGDMYGNDGVVLTSSTAAITAHPFNYISGGTNEQLIDLVFDTTVTPVFAADRSTIPGTYTTGQNYPLTTPQIQMPGYFNGCVLTFLDGPAAGRSTRIVGWTANDPSNASSYVARVMAVEGFQSSAISGSTHSVLINGRPFNGTGFGFKPDSYTAGTTPLNMPDPGFTVTGGAYYAMSPNPIYFTASTNYPMPGGLGGADEDYDAADLQNMALAYMPLSPTTSGGASILTATGGMSQISILPSFHRPDLIWYYLQGQTKAPFEWQYSDLNVLRHAMLRPIGGFDFSASGGPVADHPAFTGSNPSFNPVNGPFDVDNDGDGIRESVWIDVGFPVQTAADGRTYKPLAAILCLDMDGRLNVNAHGNIADVDQYRLRSTPGTTASSAESAMTVPPAAICNNTGATFPLVQRGEGYGPAEISLFPLFSTIGTLQAPFRAGGAIAPYTALLASRYGEANSNVYDPVLDNGVNTPSPYTTDTTAMWTASAGTKVSGGRERRTTPIP